MIRLRSPRLVDVAAVIFNGVKERQRIPYPRSMATMAEAITCRHTCRLCVSA